MAEYLGHSIKRVEELFTTRPEEQ
jgi:hypothetical protein